MDSHSKGFSRGHNVVLMWSPACQSSSTWVAVEEFKSSHVIQKPSYVSCSYYGNLNQVPEQPGNMAQLSSIHGLCWVCQKDDISSRPRGRLGQDDIPRWFDMINIIIAPCSN